MFSEHRYVCSTQIQWGLAAKLNAKNNLHNSLLPRGTWLDCLRGKGSILLLMQQRCILIWLTFHMHNKGSAVWHQWANAVPHTISNSPQSEWLAWWCIYTRWNSAWSPVCCYAQRTNLLLCVASDTVVGTFENIKFYCTHFIPDIGCTNPVVQLPAGIVEVIVWEKK